ncbi:beta-1,3-galactosyltransferase 1 isoform X2 [Procambarus clarkii]|nr:beta-1,3-galactosyltransferase 1-like isoform X2 [Procambarus clarkii]XP_045625543.1 beta-1,3-galactosyltransferase 1-like isoform X2 [Procambarus clarkii]
MVFRLLVGMCVCTGLFVAFLCVTLPSIPRPLTPATFAYRFDRVRDVINLTGTPVNTIPDEVGWEEDLSQEPLCNDSSPFILVVVPSALHHFQERQTIRTTWASPHLYPYTWIRTVFVLGATSNNTLQELIYQEMDLHHDIIQNTFVDSYRNLTYKTISWLSWVRDWCPETPFVAKIDDDVVVNPFHLLQYLRLQISRDSAPSKIHGRLSRRAPSHRNGKWAVTEEEYPDKFFPPFVFGPAYIVGRNAVERLLAYVAHTPFLWLEDVYITGLVARAAGIRHVNIGRELYTKKPTRKLYGGKVAFYIGASEKNKAVAWAGILKYAGLKNRRKRK